MQGDRFLCWINNIWSMVVVFTCQNSNFNQSKSGDLQTFRAINTTEKLEVPDGWPDRKQSTVDPGC